MPSLPIAAALLVPRAVPISTLEGSHFTAVHTSKIVFEHGESDDPARRKQLERRRRAAEFLQSRSLMVMHCSRPVNRADASLVDGDAHRAHTGMEGAVDVGRPPEATVKAAQVHAIYAMSMTHHRTAGFAGHTQSCAAQIACMGGCALLYNTAGRPFKHSVDALSCCGSIYPHSTTLPVEPAGSRCMPVRLDVSQTHSAETAALQLDSLGKFTLQP